MTGVKNRMQGKVCLITGATSGIGKATALGIAGAGATVVGVGRDQRKCERVAEEIRRVTGNPRVEYLLADLSSQAEIRRLAAQFREPHARLDVLVNNVGGVFYERRQTADGLEMTFALNYLGHFLTTNLLLDVLKASAPSRVLNVTSGAEKAAQLDFEDLQACRSYGGFPAYARSKLANLLFTYELARRLEGTGVTVNAMSPGLVATRLGTSGDSLLGRIVGLSKRLVNVVGGLSPAQGAETVVYLAISPDVDGVTGQYFKGKRPIRSSPQSYSRAQAMRLWQVSAELTGLPAEP